MGVRVGECSDRHDGRQLAAKIMYADSDMDTVREKAAEYENLQNSVYLQRAEVCGRYH